MYRAYVRELISTLDELLDDELQRTEWIVKQGAGFHSWTETLVDLEGYLLQDTVIAEFQREGLAEAVCDKMVTLRKMLIELADRHGTDPKAAEAVVRDPSFSRVRVLARSIKVAVEEYADSHELF